MIFGQEHERRSRYNRQVQLQTCIPQADPIAKSAGIGRPESSKWGEFYQADTRPWKRSLGYEMDDKSLRSQFEATDPCYIPCGMTTEPLRFPNLVTTHERDPAHAKRIALYTRYTPLEWTQSNLSNYSEADYTRNYSERLRNDFVKVMRQTEEKTAQGQRESGRRLGERITDTVFWRNELRTELERMLTEINLLQNTRDALRKAVEDIERPLNIAQECLYQRKRENRQYGGHVGGTQQQDDSEVLERTRQICPAAVRLRYADKCLRPEIWDAWTNTNNALTRRSSETLETKNKLQTHLHKVQQEIFDLEKHIELLKKAILDKSNPLKVAQTRLEARAHRKEIELCRDPPHERLVSEVRDLQDSIEALHRKLKEAQGQLQQLLRTRSKLESDLHNKVNSLFIDREKCLGMRRAFPITAVVKY
ncbi:hypothetical protein NQ317_004855 [Molorchus minor]|uniref:Tektin n=1 Tax=Molorchus minor TaxID=1323400 RepID=A0ABQ9J7V4_9CUCU|nr:hypothetical protein NQ317_004855 [Molorchus minor]